MRKKFRCFFLISLLIALIEQVSAQNIAINDGGAPPDASAMLDVYSTSKGMLIPRMRLTQRLAITNPANGLLVYQNDGLTGIYAYDGMLGVWKRLSFYSEMDLTRVLFNGSDANRDTIYNLRRLGAGMITSPRTTIEVDSSLTIQGSSGVKYFANNVYDDGTNLRYLNNGYADLYGVSNNVSGIFHWTSGLAGTLLPSDPNSFVRLEDDAVVINGNDPNFSIRLDGDVEVRENLQVEGEINSPSTGNFNLKPLAMARVLGSTGSLTNGTPNISCTRTGIGEYEITVTGHSANINSDFVSATLVGGGAGSITMNSLGGKYIVHTYSPDALSSLIPADRHFSIIIYAP